MLKSETRGGRAAHMTITLCLGGIVALGAALLVLLAISAAISRGILKTEAADRAAVAACAVGSMVGTSLVRGGWNGKYLLAGIGTGLITFLLLLGVGFIMGNGTAMGGQALAELAGCVGGGAVVGLLGGQKKKKGKKRMRTRKG